MGLRLSGFELDRERAELRRPDGKTIKLRPKTLEMLRLFAANTGRSMAAGAFGYPGRAGSTGRQPDCEEAFHG